MFYFPKKRTDAAGQFNTPSQRPYLCSAWTAEDKSDCKWEFNNIHTTVQSSHLNLHQKILSLNVEGKNKKNFHSLYLIWNALFLK